MNILILFILVIGALQFFSNSYDDDILPKDKSIKIGSDWVYLFYYPSYHNPLIEDWKTEEIVATILNSSNKTPLTISVIPENPMIHSPLSYYSEINKLNLTVLSGGFDPIPIFQSDFILTLKDRKGYWGIEDDRRIFSKANYLQDLFEQHIDDFVLIKNIRLPAIWAEGSELLIYKSKERYQIMNKSWSTPAYAVSKNFSNCIQLLGYDIDIVGNKSKERELYGRNLNIFKITYYWQCLKEMDHNYTMLVSFQDANGRIAFSQNHSACYGAFQTTNWKEGDVVKEGYYLYVPNDVQPGIYRIQICLWCPSTGVFSPVQI